MAYAAINYLSCLLIPEAIDPAFATWRGIELSKNGLGYSALMLTIIGITANSSNFERIFYNKLGKMLALLGAGLTIMAFSTTNIIALFVISSILFLKKVSNIFILIGSQRFFFNFFLIIIFILGIITSFYSKEILAQIPGIFGKDTSLTGRDVIWLYIWSEIKKQFLLGYGYGTYWIMGSHIIDLFTAFAGWRVNEAHNGFLEILLQLGLIGFIVFVAILFKYTIKAFRNDNLPSLLLLTGIVIVNFSESFIFNPRDIATFLFMLNYLLLHKKDEQYTALKNDFN
ncbi:MAG: O-antigen ligase family protein [Nitrososphaeria archaeon]